MGVWCTDRLTGEVLGVPRLTWGLLGQGLVALQVPRAEAFVPDGYVPSWLGRSWGDALFERLGELVVVARPLPGRALLRPVAAYRRGSPAALSWARSGEQLSVYDLPLATLMLRYAQFCSAGTGHTTTTLRPPAPGTPISDVAARVRRRRSGLLPAGPSGGRPGSRPAAPARAHGRPGAPPSRSRPPSLPEKRTAC